MTTTIHLMPAMFQPKEQTLVESGSLTATAFRYPSGAMALRLANGRGELIMLPFQGQQIWSARFGERELTMRSMFDDPSPTSEYLRNYGGFLIHCGFTTMGVPGPDDSHPLHGELPNATYDTAHIVLGEDETGPYIGLGGSYRHTVAFSYNYVAEPLVKLYADQERFHIRMRITNLKQTPMEYMYLAHVNFRPVDHGRLLYSAETTPEHVRVRASIPSHVTPGPGYAEFLDALRDAPQQHHVLRPDLAFDPEVVFNIDYLADDAGWAHSLQVHPDGSADYIGHRPDQLPIGVRWICRTPDQDALGIVLPATAEPEGYLAEKSKGNIRMLDGGDIFTCDMTVAALGASAAGAMADRINAIVDGA